MAAYNKFQVTVENLLRAVHNLGTGQNDVKVYLSNVAPNAATMSVKADLAEIAAGNGYPAGGTTVSNDVARTAGTARMTAQDVTWTASGGTIGPFRYTVMYDDTPTSPADPLISWWDYGSALTLQDGESFRVNFGAEAFTLT